MGFPKIVSTLLGVPIIRTIVFAVYIGGPGEGVGTGMLGCWNIDLGIKQSLNNHSVLLGAASLASSSRS